MCLLDVGAAPRILNSGKSTFPFSFFLILKNIKLKLDILQIIICFFFLQNNIQHTLTGKIGIYPSVNKKIQHTCYVSCVMCRPACYCVNFKLKLNKLLVKGAVESKIAECKTCNLNYQYYWLHIEDKKVYLNLHLHIVYKSACFTEAFSLINRRETIGYRLVILYIFRKLGRCQGLLYNHHCNL